MKRLLALAGALAMVAAAFFIRAAINADSDSGSDSGPSSASSDGDQATLLCIEALAEACEALTDEFDNLTIDIAPAGETIDNFSQRSASAKSLGVDGWLTFRSFPQILGEERDRAGAGLLLEKTTDILGRSPLVIVIWNDRNEVLVSDCGKVDWRCIGERAGTAWSDIGGQAGWGRLEPGFDNPDSTATGLLVIGQASNSYFGNDKYASNDFDSAFRSWLGNLEDSVPVFPASRGTVLSQMLATGPASYDLVGTTEAEAGPAVERSRDRDRLTITYPSPTVTADVVFAPIEGADAGSRLKEIATSAQAAAILAQNGFRVDGEPAAPGVADQPLPDGDGLPRPGVLEALRQL